MPNLLGNIALAGTLAQTLADAILAAITNAQIVAQLSKSLEELGESGQASIAVKVTASVDLDSLVPLATAYITLQGGLDIELGVSVLEAAGGVESVISGIVRNLSNEPIEGVDCYVFISETNVLAGYDVTDSDGAYSVVVTPSIAHYVIAFHDSTTTAAITSRDWIA